MITTMAFVGIFAVLALTAYMIKGCQRVNAEYEQAMAAERMQELARAPGATVVVAMEPIDPEPEHQDAEFEEGPNMAKLHSVTKDQTEEPEVDTNTLMGPDGEILEGELPEYALQE